MSDEISLAAENAIEILRERGWCQGDYRSPDGRICLESALLRSLVVMGLMPEIIDSDFRFPGNAQEDWDDSPAWRTCEKRVLAIAGDLFPDRPCGEPYDFNDDWRTSEEDVYLVLKTLAGE